MQNLRTLFKNCKILNFLNSQNNSYFIFQIFVNENIRNLIEMVKNNIGCSIHYATPLPYLIIIKFNLKNLEIQKNTPKEYFTSSTSRVEKSRYKIYY